VEEEIAGVMLFDGTVPLKKFKSSEFKS